jgi:hypothetical protein
MECNDILGLISQFLKTELSKKDARKLFEHLASCPNCPKVDWSGVCPPPQGLILKRVILDLKELNEARNLLAKRFPNLWSHTADCLGCRDFYAQLLKEVGAILGEKVDS